MRNIFIGLGAVIVLIGGFYLLIYSQAPNEITQEIAVSETDTTNVPFNKIDKEFSVDGGTWPIRVVLEDNTLFWNWRSEHTGEWESVMVEKPPDLKYVGEGIFSDGIKVYTVSNLVGTDILDPHKNILIVSEKNQTFIQNGEKLFAVVSDLSVPALTEVEGINIDELEIIGGGYFKDSGSVFFMRGNVWKLDSANPDNFIAYQPDENEEYFILGISGNSDVYYYYKLLEGVDFKEMIIENGRTIIRDNDTVWFQSGGCHFGDFREGTFEEIPSYQPPC